MTEIAETELLTETKALERQIEILNCCEPSMPVRFWDTKNERPITIRSFGCDDKIEGLFKMLIGLYDGINPVGICQMGIPLKPEYGHNQRKIGYCGSRNNSSYFLETLPLDYYGQQAIRKHFRCFDNINGPGNDAFVIDEQYQGQDYAQLLLLVTQLLAQKRGVDKIRFMEDKTMKKGASYYAWATAGGESNQGNTIITTSVDSKQLKLLEQFVPQ